MTKDKELLIWKSLAVGAALVYLYKVAKSNGGSLQNSAMGVNMNPEKVVGLASQFVPQHLRPQAQQMGMNIWNNLANRGGQDVL